MLDKYFEQSYFYLITYLLETLLETKIFFRVLKRRKVSKKIFIQEIHFSDIMYHFGNKYFLEE